MEAIVGKKRALKMYKTLACLFSFAVTLIFTHKEVSRHYHPLILPPNV